MAQASRELARRIAQKALDRRSPVYQWLAENYATIKAAPKVRGFWPALADTAAEAGKVDATGKPPTPDALRAAFARVERDKSGGTRTMERRPAKPPKPAEPATTPPAVPDVAHEGDEDLTPKYTFRPGGPKR